MYFVKPSTWAGLALLVGICLSDFSKSEECSTACTPQEKIYDYYPSQLSFNSADFGCETLYPGQKYVPAAIETEIDHILMSNKIVSLLRGSSWTSGYRNASGEPFRWRSAGHVPFTFTRWANEIPPGDDETGCVAVVGSPQGLVWTLADCTAPNYVICSFCPK